MNASDRIVYQRVIIAPTAADAARKLATWLAANIGVTILGIDVHHAVDPVEFHVTFDRPTVPPAAGADVPDLSIIAHAIADAVNSLNLPVMISDVFLEPPDGLADAAGA